MNKIKGFLYIKLGYDKEYLKGYKDACDKKHNESYNEIFDTGYKDGYSKGQSFGYDQGFDDGFYKKNGKIGF